jgi:hypothetical protein
MSCPFGFPVSRLWVRETARVVEVSASRLRVRVVYEADGTESGWLPYPERLKRPKVGNCIANGVHREGSRLTLEVTEVRVQRCSEITEGDALAEGVEANPYFLADGTRDEAMSIPAKANFEALWASLYGPEAWNQWCWAVTFRRLP